MEEDKTRVFSPETGETESSKLNKGALAAEISDADPEAFGAWETGSADMSEEASDAWETGSTEMSEEASDAWETGSTGMSEDASGTWETGSAEMTGEAAFIETERTSAGSGAADGAAAAAAAAETDSSAAGSAVSAGTETGSPAAGAAAVDKAASRARKAENEVENTLARVRPNAKKKTGKDRTATYQDKIRRHKRRRYRRNVALVVLATLVLTGAVILWMCRGYTRAELNRIAVLTAEDSSEYTNLGGNVVQYGTSGALCIDQRGNTAWNVTYEMQQPVTSISGNMIAIADRSGYDVYVMDQKGLKSTIRTSLPIHSIAVGESGAVAVIMNDSRTTWVRLYSAEGKEIAYIIRSMNESGYPIAAAVSPDGETMCLSSVQMSNASVMTNISFYNFGRAGRDSADHVVQQSDNIDEVIPFLHYIDSNTCVCISDAKLYCYWKPLLRSPGSSSIALPDNVQGVFTSESFIGVLFADTKGDAQYRLNLYNKRGKEVGSVGFSIPYTNISISGDKVYINNDQQCQIYTIGGRRLYDGTFGRTIRALIPGASLSDLLVVTAEEVDSVRLH